MFNISRINISASQPFFMQYVRLLRLKSHVRRCLLGNRNEPKTEKAAQTLFIDIIARRRHAWARDVRDQLLGRVESLECFLLLM